MEYGRLQPSEPGGSSKHHVAENPSLPQTATSSASSTSRSRKNKLILISLLSVALILASAVSAVVLFAGRSKASNSAASSALHRKPTKAISDACARTRFPSLCVDSLLDFPGSTTASEQDLVHISFNMTLQRLSKALYLSSSLSYRQMDPYSRSAYDDCLELLDDSVDALSRALTSVIPGAASTSTSTQDVLTWLSAALTNQDTCGEGFEQINGGDVKNEMDQRLKDLSELVSNCLAIYSAIGGGDFSGVPIQNRRRRLLGNSDMERDIMGDNANVSRDFPRWLGRRERRLLAVPGSQIQADIIVSKDGSGTFKTIAEAIKKAPESSSRRTIIYVKAGRYEESNLKVARKKTNLMFIGDGKGKTIITGGKNVAQKVTTFHTATFAAQGAGFIARDLTFENYAGPDKHQAVALRIGADHAVVYHCSIIGYQDTFYVHSNRQFVRETDIYGTVDFIFGNAAVVFQKCSLYARKPMANQKNTITAQNRKDPNQNTGISIHDCRILATPELEGSKGSFPTYLGRPWKLYSRTVYMLSFIGDHVHPHGWLEWNATFALDTLYYGEYMNYGPGGAIGKRVTWPGYRVITSQVEAARFTVRQFIYGSSWLPSTGVAFLAGLSV
ncbi:probable pectinesterase/pectinesterase inhibitor 34 [Pyrus x bretschneideri]|uniref:Pectinesterase n=1 Tax=Pyrus x bretschneideri TaxID=225117 RepID=S5M3J8_9ROSA|nr:probable pectinesterase/pectinesterase inhibitor 34 [Pyrus x bretschneideri]AGR44471.1 pectin methylesterase 1 [Pyrus x bretschneideri]